MTQMADKDRPCTPLCFLLPTPTLFSIFRAGPGWRKWRKAATERGRRDEKGNETGVEEGQRGPGSSSCLERNRRGLKAIYRPRGAGGGGAGPGHGAADTGITNNPTRRVVLLWS